MERLSEKACRLSGKSMQIVSQKHCFYCAIKRELQGKSNGFPLFFV
jgi:hypothetical protein